MTLCSFLRSGIWDRHMVGHEPERQGHEFVAFPSFMLFKAHAPSLNMEKNKLPYCRAIRHPTKKHHHISHSARLLAKLCETLSQSVFNHALVCPVTDQRSRFCCWAVAGKGSTGQLQGFLVQSFNGMHLCAIKPQLQENLKKPQCKTEDIKISKRPETRHEKAWKCIIQACLTKNRTDPLDTVVPCCSLVRSNHYLSNQPSWTCCWAFPHVNQRFLGTTNTRRTGPRPMGTKASRPMAPDTKCPLIWSIEIHCDPFFLSFIHALLILLCVNFCLVLPKNFAVKYRSLPRPEWSGESIRCRRTMPTIWIKDDQRQQNSRTLRVAF